MPADPQQNLSLAVVHRQVLETEIGLSLLARVCLRHLSLAAVAERGADRRGGRGGALGASCEGRGVGENQRRLRAAYRTLELPGKNPLKDAHAALDADALDAYGF
jgi:hypothetical protein